MRAGFRSVALLAFACAQFGLASSEARAQDGVRVPTDSSFGVRPADLPDCRDAARLFLIIGGRAIAPPRGAVELIVPYHLTVTGNINTPDEMWMDLPAEAGCESSPIETSIAFVPAELSGSSVDVILAAQPSGPFTEMARLRDSGRCDPLDGSRVGCAGSTQVDGQVVEVTAVIASDPAATASDGLPVFMICERAAEGLFCEASGVRAGVGFKALWSGSVFPSVEEMRTAYDAVDAAFADWGG